MFSINYKVTVSDINYGGHMGNERALILFQQGRIDFFKNLNLSEINIGDDIGTIQLESHVKYLKEVYLGEVLKINIDDIVLKKTSMDFIYSVYNENNEKVLEGSTLILAYNYERKKVSKIPSIFLEKLRNGEKYENTIK